MGSEEYSDSDFPLDGFNFDEVVEGGVLNEEFMLYHVGKTLQEYFLSEFDRFVGSFTPNDQPKRKIKKKVGKVNRKGSPR